MIITPVKSVRAFEVLPAGNQKKLVVGIEHIDNPENCDLLFNYAEQCIKPTNKVLNKDIHVVFNS
jgi:hypothetical protein